MTIEQAQELANSICNVLPYKVACVYGDFAIDIPRVEISIGRNTLFSLEINRLVKIAGERSHFITSQGNDLIFIIC